MSKNKRGPLRMFNMRIPTGLTPPSPHVGRVGVGGSVTSTKPAPNPAIYPLPPGGEGRGGGQGYVNQTRA